MSCIKQEDIISTLQHLGLVRYCKGQHVINTTAKVIEQHLAMLALKKKQIKLDPSALKWVPPRQSTKRHKQK